MQEELNPYFAAMLRHRIFILTVQLVFGSCLLHAQRTDSSAFELSESPKIQRMMREFIESNATQRTTKGYRVQIANGSKAEHGGNRSSKKGVGTTLPSTVVTCSNSNKRNVSHLMGSIEKEGDQRSQKNHNSGSKVMI